MTEDAVRYYEKIGLLPPVKRKANGHRVFSEDDKKETSAVHQMFEENGHVFRGNEAVPQPAGTDRSLG